VQASIDLPLLGGWHVTLFHPWWWMALAAIVWLAGAAVVKFLKAR
jgi:hypothetical protein